MEESSIGPSEFLALLYPAGVPEYDITIWSRRSKASAHVPLENVGAQTATWAARGHEIYYGVCARRKGLASTTRGKARDCRVIPGFWLDVDLANAEAHAVKDESGALKALPTNMDEALEILTHVGPGAPTAIVDSGYGIHAYWLFDTPITLQDESQAEIWHAHCKQFQVQFQDYAKGKGWHVDGTGTLDRILRLPGTVNHKTSTPRPVQVLMSDGPRYNPADIMPQAKQAPAPRGALPSGTEPTPAAPVDARGTAELHAALGENLTRGWGSQETRDLLGKIYRGEMYAAHERDTKLQRIASALAFMFPGADPLALAGVCAKSLEHHDDIDHGKFTQDDRLEWARDKIERAQSDKATKDAIERAEAAEMARSILGYEGPAEDPDAPADPWRMPIPITPNPYPVEMRAEFLYARDQVARWGAAQGCSSSKEFETGWILQVGEFYHVFVDGAYQPGVKLKGLEHSVRRDLSRAWPYVELNYPVDGKEGEPPTYKPKQIKRLMEEYGTVVRTTTVELGLPTSVFERTTGTFREAAAPLRTLLPRFNAHVDTWLRLLGGAHADLLLDWVASVTRLDKQCAALYLEGPKGTGKTMLGQGLARLWTRDGWTDLSSVLGEWSDGLMRCPFLVADEHIPQKYGRSNASAELRSLIGNSSHRLARKFKDTSALRGAVRVYLAGNNENLLSFDKEELAADDLAAVAQRFLHILHDNAAQQFLATISTDGWVDQDIIAEHALWLHANRIVRPGTRFIVEGNFRSERLATQGSSTRAKVVEWIVRCIEKPIHPGGPQGENLVQVGDGRVLVNVEALAKFWTEYVKTDHSPPPTTALGRALRAVSMSPKAIRPDGTKRYWDVNVAVLNEWAEAQGFDVELIQGRILAPVAEFGRPAPRQIPAVPIPLAAPTKH